MMTVVVLFVVPADMPVVMMLLMVAGIPAPITTVTSQDCRTEKQQETE